MDMDRDTDREKILIVDDEASIRSLLKRLLERNGYVCVLASDARDAKRIMEDEHLDLILCDIQMPEESGLELALYVTSEYPDVAIVMVTVIGNQETVKTLLGMGVYGYILKPFDENQLLISVANALRRRELEMQQRSYRQDLERTVRERTATLSRMNGALKKSESELKAQKKELEEANSALRVLLKKREEDKSELEKNILTSVKKTVEPFLEKLKRSRTTNEQKVILSIVESNIKEMTSSFVKELSSAYLDLSPKEIEVSGLIKQGMTTKEIADILHLSDNTIMSHRYNIRRKLGLLNKKQNLVSFLHSLR
jgi:DNA-binding NarL/FixJ family response regulator